MHTREQGEQADYYRELADLIRQYDEVLLFGPTEAKTELYNTFKDNHLFSEIKVEIRPADKMTENQQHTFVSSYFKVDVN
jgi:ADP-heptose:LPS heptosyltransferase